ncbi:MAG: ParB/RepB/Spo0J family partition protein [Gemmatimonas sp.]
MAPPDKPNRLGRGLDALLARRDAKTAAATPAPTSPPPESPHAAVPSAPNVVAHSAPNAGSAGSTPPNVTPPSTTGTASAGAGAAGTPVTAQAAAPSTDAPTASAPATAAVDPHAPGYRPLPIAAIAPNPFQPRKEFHPQDLDDLKASLKSQGLLQPITVRPSPNHSGYELIAGERRFRAATALGWKEIPAIIRATDDYTMLTLAMVENLQRADLDPIEEADGYQRLIDEFDATQQEVADVVGKERSTVANALRLLALPASVKRMLQERKITVGHARALLPLETERAMADLARDIVAKSLSVRDVESKVRAARPSPAKTGRKAKPADSGVSAGSSAASAELRRLEELLRKKMQTTVNIHLTAKDRGELRIAFFSNDDLERVLELLGINFDS